jgi:hypothetical protein
MPETFRHGDPYLISGVWTKVGLTTSGTIALSCPLCGILQDINYSPNGRYSIEDNGLLWPSVCCQSPQCDWHAPVLLAGWPAPD